MESLHDIALAGAKAAEAIRRKRKEEQLAAAAAAAAISTRKEENVEEQESSSSIEQQHTDSKAKKRKSNEDDVPHDDEPLVATEWVAALEEDNINASQTGESSESPAKKIKLGENFYIFFCVYATMMTIAEQNAPSFPPPSRLAGS